MNVDNWRRHFRGMKVRAEEKIIAISMHIDVDSSFHIDDIPKDVSVSLVSTAYMTPPCTFFFRFPAISACDKRGEPCRHRHTFSLL